jgi:hypothetical protein
MQVYIKQKGMRLKNQALPTARHKLPLKRSVKKKMLASSNLTALPIRAPAT